VERIRKSSTPWVRADSLPELMNINGNKRAEWLAWLRAVTLQQVQ